MKAKKIDENIESEMASIKSSSELLSYLNKLESTTQDKALPLINRKDYQTAVQEFDKIVAAYENAIALVDQRGSTLDREGVSDYLFRNWNYWQKQAARIRPDPESAEQYLKKGKQLRGVGKFKDALDNFEKAKGLTSLPSLRGEIIAEIGNTHYDQGNYMSAEECYSEAIKLDQDNATHWFNRGNAQSKRLDFVSAIDSYEKVIKIDPRDSEALEQIALSYLSLGKVEEALKYLKRATSIDPYNSRYWHNSGYVLTLKKNYEEALRCFDRALLIDPENTQVLIAKGDCIISASDDDKMQQPLSLEKERLEEALKLYEKAADTYGNKSMALFKKGLTLCNLSRYSDAAESFQKALKITPTSMNLSVALKESLAAAVLFGGKPEVSLRMAVDILNERTLALDLFGEYIIRVVALCSLYSLKRAEEGRKQATQLLEFYNLNKSLLADPWSAPRKLIVSAISNYCIKSSILGNDEKELIDSFVDLWDRGEEK